MTAVETRRRPAWRRPTVRLRLTLLYSGLFLVTGAVLIGLVYVLVAHGPLLGSPPEPEAPTGDLAVGPPELAGDLREQAERQRAEDVRRLLTASLIALTVLAGISFGLGWIVAGRVLRPLGEMSARVRRISADALDQRLAATGPDDELTELAGTFDDLLARLESAFAAQRRFVAHASHELRTPLTLQRAVVDVTLGEADATAEALRAALARVRAAGQRQERIIEALLTLARSQPGLLDRQPVDLAESVAVVVAELTADAAARGVEIDVTLDPAPAAGDPGLLERLIRNLLDNAVRHNQPGGRVCVSTAAGPDGATLRVVNSGPVIPAEAVVSLYEPFQRLGGRRGADDGLGLGLSIAAAVVDAHGGTLTTVARPEGGLDLTVRLLTL
ncbi:HAMP domain-containing sensor histidine kinase [Jiangella alkaliphila]|uniref:histidine kinase n=1 Tax=Jiangella alkaliphila TaxID=419479 RepID=A0A1H2LFC2_9ACTN|nr:ATP-binding protein [Jiangella alkaliphila]SDU79609.1 Signal transduction histidine kinase [Jiangella alkaliphila]